MGNDYSINATMPDDPAQLDGSRLKLRLPPPRRWRASRPGDVARSPWAGGALLGSPAPDAGFVLRLYRLVEPSVTDTEGIDRLDLRTAIQSTALERASILGRAPTRGDVEWALAYWGFGLEGVFDPSDSPPSRIDRRRRRELFRGCSHDALKQRVIASLVDKSMIAIPPKDLQAPRRDTR